MTSHSSFTPTIDVSGKGIVRVIPDEAVIRIRVEHTGDDSKKLKKENDAVVNRTLKFIKSMMIADGDIRTEYMNLTKNYDYNTKTYSFTANQSLSIKLRELSLYEKLIAGLLDSGINRIDGVDFSSSEQDILESQARKNAIENARMKAKEYASVLGQSVGKAVSISEFNSANDPQPKMLRMASAHSAPNADGGSVAFGEMEIRSLIYVRFQLH